MPGISPTDINVISSENSAHNVALGVNAFFNGAIIDVSDYTTITVAATGLLAPAATDAIQMEWYDSDNTLLSTSVFGSNATNAQTVHAVVRGQKMRVRYHASAFGQSALHIETLLRRGTIAGSVSPVGFVTGTPDAQVINSIPFGRLAAGTFQPTAARVDDTTTTVFNQIVVPPLNRATIQHLRTTASLTSVQIDLASIASPTRRFLTITNETVRGNLYLRLGTAVTLTNYDYKLPPQHSYDLPQSWPMYGVASGGQVFGIWDVADGFAHCIEGA